MVHRPRFLIVAVLALLAAILVPSAPVAAVVDPTAAIFLNELHYDNAGADTGEFVEVAGPAGTDLSGWTIELVNGNGGAPYGTIALSGTILDQDDGFGTLSFASAGLQNGSPDGLALIDPASAVVEFLSYEGSFTSTGGVTAGLTSTDLGVSESSSTPIGSSLGRTGTGALAGDFAWQPPAAATPGAVNTGQDFVSTGGDPFIAEIHYDNTGSDTGEFVEIEGAAGTDLAGWTLVLYNGNGGGEYGSAALGGTIDDEGAGRGAVAVPIPGLQNGSPDGVALVGPGDVVVEFLSYEGSFAAIDGPAAGMTSTDIGVSEPSSTPVGFSLQLIDGTWNAPAAASPGVLNGTTTGGPGVPFPLTEGFDIDDCTATGWEVVSVDADAANTWSCSSQFSNADVNGFGDAAPADEWLISPALDMDAQTGEVLDFRNFTDFSDIDYPQLEVLYATDYDGAGDPSTATWTALSGINYSPEDSGTWVDSGPIDLSAITGQRVHVAFRYTSSGTGAGSAATWRVDSVEFTVGDNERFIHEVQGSLSDAALLGQTVTVQGIVTSLFTRDDVLDGFFVQEEDVDADADASTSEGIFIFCRFGAGCPGAVAAGDLVTVTGTVTEFFGMSQIDTGSGSIVIDSSGNPLPTAVAVDLPASGRTDAEATFEAVEGMLVAFTDKLVISEYFQLGRFGQIVLTADARPLQFTSTNAPSVAGFAAFGDDLASRRIILDDDNNDQNDTTSDADFNEIYPWPSGGLSTTNFFRGGDSITDLTGVLHWSFAGSGGTDAWRIRPVDGVDYTFAAENPRPAAPADVGGRLKVASFNVLNYFTTLDEPGAVCGPSALGCRGAHSVAELDRQRSKIVAAMAEIDADVLGLVEIENDEGAAAADLVAALNTATAPGTYAALDTGSIGGDAIKVALVYQPATVTPVGDFTVLDMSVDPRFIDSKNRPVLIQTFEEVATRARVTVAVNHLKSKGSPCDDVGDPGLNDGQGNCNLTRTAAAQAMADYLATDPTGSGDADVLIIGDLNAYAMEDPVTALEAAGYTDLIEAFEGPSAYSFVFSGQLGYLDHALANGPLLPQVTGVAEWHINADEINLLDYNDDIRDAGEASFERESTNGGLDLFDPDPYRSSDHDPVVVGLNLDAPMCNGLEATIIGTDAGETIFGTRGNDVIVARGGDDIVRGRGGNDVICGGSGNDRLFGQAGWDTLLGEGGNDRLFGGSDDDTMSGGPGDDLLSGGQGDDDGTGGPGMDRLLGGSGNDGLDGGGDDDEIVGGSGWDTLTGGEGNDEVRGNSGADHITGGPGDDMLDGGSGDDRVFGEAGDDMLRGRSGNDLLDGGDDIDEIDGGANFDTCRFGEVVRRCEK